jgi:hypothetical protein
MAKYRVIPVKIYSTATVCQFGQFEGKHTDIVKKNTLLQVCNKQKSRSKLLNFINFRKSLSSPVQKLFAKTEYRGEERNQTITTSVADPDPTFHSNGDPDPTFPFDLDPDPTPHFFSRFGPSNAPKWPSTASTFSL